jgi:hypothetical protein
MKLATLFPLFLIITSCAYGFGPHHRQLPGGHQKIFVKMFENRTQEVGVESDVTDAMIQELARSGVGTITSEAEADEVVEGVIHTIDYLGKTPLTLDNKHSLFTEYQTRVNMVVKVIDKQNKELWQGQIMGEKNYKAPQLTIQGLRTADPLYNQSARRQTIRAIAKDMATETISRMTENF